MAEDIILIENLHVRGIIGINDWERDKQQDIFVNITLFTDLQKPMNSDNIDDTVNYRTVAKQVIDLVESSRRYTVEALAGDIMTICLEQKHVTRARVRVEKPGALRFAKSVGVEITRDALRNT